MAGGLAEYVTVFVVEAPKYCATAAVAIFECDWMELVVGYVAEWVT